MGLAQFDASRRGKKPLIFAITVKARTVVGRGEKGLLSDLLSDLHLGRKKEKERIKCKGNDWDDGKKTTV